MTSFRSPEEEELTPPSGLAFKPNGDLIVADDFNHRIQVYDSDLKVNQVFGEKGDRGGCFNYPRGVAADNEGCIYVADSWNHRVQKFDGEGKFILSFGGYGDKLGQMNEPYDLFVENPKNIVVVERYNHRIQFFDSDGKSQGFIGSRATVMEDQIAWIYDTPPAMFPRPSFEFPTSITRDGMGNYFIADSGNHRIVKFDKEWNVVLTFGRQGENPGEFQYPMCAATGPNDLLYVADLNNNRIQAFDTCGRFIFTLDEGSQSIESPCLVQVDSQGRLFVGMTFQPRIEIFETPLQTRKELREHASRENPENFAIRMAEGISLEEEGKTDLAREAYAAAVSLLPISNLSLNDPLAESALTAPIHFAKTLSKKSVDEKTGKLLIDALGFYDKAVEFLIRDFFHHREQYEAAANDATRKRIAEEDRILQQKEDPLTFNRELYNAQEEDKKLFRKTRLLFIAHRFRTECRAEFTSLLLDDRLPESLYPDLINGLRERFVKSRERIQLILDEKEKNEEEMVASFSDPTNDASKWIDFKIRFSSNERNLNAVKQFQNELRMTMKQLVISTRTLPSSLTEPTLRELLTSQAQSAAMQKTLLGLQEDWLGYPEVERDYLDVLDAWVSIQSSLEKVQVTSITLDALTPVACEKEENLAGENMLTLFSESMPIKLENGVLHLGHGRFLYDWPQERIGDLMEQIRSAFDNMENYAPKFKEIFDNLETLTRQLTELDNQLKNIDPRDKRSPIPLRNNSYILIFQIGLLRRMIRTLEINEMNNVFRVVLGTALLTKNCDKNIPVKDLLGAIEKLHIEIADQVEDGIKKKKDLFYEKTGLDNQLSEEFSADKTAAFEQRTLVMGRLANIQLETDRLNCGLNKLIRKKNLLRSLLSFSGQNHSDSSSGSAWKFKKSFSGPSWDPKGFVGCSNIAVSPQGTIYVLDHPQHGVYRMSANGCVNLFFGGWGTGPGFMRWPRNIQTDSEGNVYVSDGLAGYVHVFSPEGRFLRRIGENTIPPLGILNDITIDSKGILWITDTENNSLKAFCSSGETAVTQLVIKEDQLQKPLGICCLSDGGLAVADRSESLLKRFDADGKLVKTIAKKGITGNDIYSLSYDSNLGIFAADIWNNQIIQFNEELDVQSIIKRPGKRLGQFREVPGTAIHGGVLYLTDFVNNKILLFEPS